MPGIFVKFAISIVLLVYCSYPNIVVATDIEQVDTTGFTHFAQTKQAIERDVKIGIRKYAKSMFFIKYNRFWR